MEAEGGGVRGRKKRRGNLWTTVGDSCETV